MPNLKIQQLNLYPVKSLRGINVDQWPIGPEGLRYDRHWMLVMPNGRFVTQRQLPQMALINTAIKDGQLILSAAGKGPVHINLKPAPEKTQDIFTAKIWRDECEVVADAPEASAWLNEVLQPPKPLRLVRMADKHRRLQSQPQRFGENTHTRFADAAPFLLANQSSLEALNARLQAQGLATVDMRRFRPNIVISGLKAFAEHNIKQLRHKNSGLNLQLCDPCKRCIITTIDPDTGIKAADMQPFKTLIELNPMPDNARAPAFAVNGVLDSTNNNTESGELKVGDPLETGTGPG